MAKPDKTVDSELHRIARDNGGVLLPESVVDAARDPDSPLHSAFTWDDDEAAQKWRIHQARNLILRVHIEVSDGKSQSITVRAWSNLTTERGDDDGGYRETIRVLKNSDQRAQLLADALAEMERFAEKYRALSELAEVFAAIRKVKHG